MNIFKSEPKHLSATAAVKWYLTKYGSIDQLTCLKKYHTWKLNRIICDLRKQGLNISTELKEVKTKYGFKSRVAVYHYGTPHH